MRMSTAAMRWLAPLLVLPLLALAGCKSDGAKLIEHYQAIVEIAEANEGDCDAMRDAITEYDAEHGQEIGDIWAKGDDMSGSDKEGDELSGLIVRVGVLAGKCGVSVPGLQ